MTRQIQIINLMSDFSSYKNYPTMIFEKKTIQRIMSILKITT